MSSSNDNNPAASGKQNVEHLANSSEGSSNPQDAAKHVAGREDKGLVAKGLDKLGAGKDFGTKDEGDTGKLGGRGA